MQFGAFKWGQKVLEILKKVKNKPFPHENGVFYGISLGALLNLQQVFKRITVLKSRRTQTVINPYLNFATAFIGTRRT